MKRWMLLVMLFASCVCQAADMYFDLSYMNANPATNRWVTLQPYSAFVGNQFSYTSSVAGGFWVSNVWTGDTLGQVKRKGSADDIPFRITVTISDSQSSVLYASNHMSVVGLQTYPSVGSTAWSIAAADRRYAPIGTAGSPNALTNGDTRAIEFDSDLAVGGVVHGNGSGLSNVVGVVTVPIGASGDVSQKLLAVVNGETQIIAGPTYNGTTGKIVSNLQGTSDASVASTNIYAGGTVTTSNVLATIPSSVMTNANVFVGFGGIQLNANWALQEFSGIPNSNHHTARISWFQTGESIPKNPLTYPIEAPQAFIDVRRNWGGGALSTINDRPTLHFASKGDIRVEPNYSASSAPNPHKWWGYTYLSLGNEDGGNYIYVNYHRGPLWVHHGGGSGPGGDPDYGGFTNPISGAYKAMKPWAKGYGIPLDMPASYMKNNVEGTSRPGIWSHSGDTNAADMSMGEIWFMSKTPTHDIWQPTVGEQQAPENSGYTVFKMRTNHTEFLMSGISVTNNGVKTLIDSNNIISGTVTANRFVGGIAPTIGGAFGNQSSGHAVQPTYFSPYSHFINVNAPDYASAPIGNACTLTNLYVSLNWGEHAANYTFRLFTNGVFCGLTCTIAADNTSSFSRVGSDTTHSATIAAGTSLSLQTTNSSGFFGTMYGGWSVQMR